jgi:hypothetical protein
VEDENPHLDAAAIGTLGWRQGSILPPSLFEEVNKLTDLALSLGDSVAVVVSQDCDVVHTSYHDEPSVEVVKARFVSELDGGLTYAKSARRLHIEIDSASGARFGELSTHHRRWLDRRLLEKAEPYRDEWLSENARKTLASWMTRRYRRDAFPDAFVTRLREKPIRRKLEKLFAKYGESISGVFILLHSTEELADDELYETVLYATVPKDIFDAGAEKLEHEFLVS